MPIPEISSAASPPPDPSDKLSTSRYIGHMAGELRRLAERADLHFLAYLLEMAESDALTSPASRTKPQP